MAFIYNYIYIYSSYWDSNFTEIVYKFDSIDKPNSSSIITPHLYLFFLSNS